jgi:multidrug efflux pump subunit AcrB
MNLATYAINRQVVTWVFVALTAIGGVVCYNTLGKLEDPEFTIKEVPVITPYPGATAIEVEKEVTELIETAVQRLGQVRRIRSLTEAGNSTVYVEIKPEYTKAQLPQVWDELRRKVNDVQAQLPPGAGPSVVRDDFGDVFGVLFCVTGDGYTQNEIYDYVKFLRRELLQVKDVARIEFWGVPEDAVYVEISSARLAALGITPQHIFSMIEQQGKVTPAGDVRVGSELLLFEPTGSVKSVADISNLLISGADPQRPIYLKDVARVAREEREPPNKIARFNGQRCIAVGISTVSGGNVVVMGDALKKRLRELEPMRPVGMQLCAVAVQSEAVVASVSGFVINVAEAFAIVVAILMVFMGVRSGVIIGIVLLLIVGGTLIGMQLAGIPMQRISLGALIVALGMLVDNAIVVCDGMQVRMQRGMDPKKAAAEIVGQMSLPLLGATVIAILAFSGIGFSPDSTGEFCKSLFQVILISLSLSWLFAVTVTPMLGLYMLKAGAPMDEDKVYDTPVYRVLSGFLALALRRRYLTLAVLAGLFIPSLLLFKTLNIGFFPDMDRPQFVIEYTLPAGTHIERTSEEMSRLERYVMRLDGVTNVSTWIGSGTLRFILTYSPEDVHAGYGMMLVTVESSKTMDALIAAIRAHMAAHFTDGDVKIWKFALGPGGKAKIEARFSGPDPLLLREFVNKAMNIMEETGRATGVRNDWRQRIKVLEPAYAAGKAQAVGVTRADLAFGLAQAYRGATVGLYREEDDLLPIVARAPFEERASVDSLNNVHIYSPALGRAVPIGQVVSGFPTKWEDQLIRRRNKLKTMTAQCDPLSGPASQLLGRIRPATEAIPLPAGYALEWGGDYEKSKEANEGISTTVPLSFLAMALILIFMFNNLRQPLAIVLSVPMAFMGLFYGFFFMSSSVTYDFIAIIATLSLVGMMIKNSIVISDQYNTDVAAGMPRQRALVHAAVVMTRPQLMAAFTTVLGVIPLLWDVFFKSLAVAIMWGLATGALLALVVVPVLIATFYGVKSTDV